MVGSFDYAFVSLLLPIPNDQSIAPMMSSELVAVYEGAAPDVALEGTDTTELEKTMSGAPRSLERLRSPGGRRHGGNVKRKGSETRNRKTASSLDTKPLTVLGTGSHTLLFPV